MSGSDENDSNAREPIDICKALAEKHGIAFLIVHHTRKGGGRGLEALRGSSAIGNAIDYYLAVERARSPKSVRLKLEKDRDGGAEEPLIFALTPGASEPATLEWEASGDPAQGSEQELDELIVGALRAQPGLNQEKLAKHVAKRREAVGEALRRMRKEGTVVGGGRNGLRLAAEGDEE